MNSKNKIENLKKEGYKMQEILNFIEDNISQIMKKKSGRIDYTTENGTKVKIYKCGDSVTRIDIVKEEKQNGTSKL